MNLKSNSVKNSILFIVLITSSLRSFSQTYTSKDTLRFSTEKTYSRAIALRGNELIIGTSTTGVLSYNLKKNTIKTLVKPVGCGEFRDVIVDGKTVYSCVSGDSGILYKVTGSKVTELYRDHSFIDDIVLRNGQLIALSDPIDNQLMIKRVSVKKGFMNQSEPMPTAEGEAYYAASGTTAQIIGAHYYYVSGGPNNATFYDLNTFEFTQRFKTELPFQHGEGAGPFSLLMLDEKNGVIVGGNYKNPNEADSTSMYTTDGGRSWTLSQKTTSGYRSCVIGNASVLYACGRNGIDVSTDGGNNWQVFDTGNFCALLLDEKTLYATTNKGYVIRYELK